MTATRKRFLFAGTLLVVLAVLGLLAFWGYRKIRGGEAVIQALEDLADLEPSNGEVASRYEEEPRLVDLRPEQLDEALKGCRRSLFFLGFFHQNRVDVEMDAFMLPNASLCEASTDWTRVLDARGRDILRKPTAEEQKELDEWPSRRTLLLAAGREVAPVLAQGSARVVVPVRFARLSISAEDTGKEVRGSGVSGALLQCRNDFFELRLSGLAAGATPTIVARDATGRALKMAGWMAKEEAGAWLTRRKAHGRVARVDVALPLETASRTISVEATAAPAQGRPAAAPRYLPPTEAPRFVSLGADAIKEQTRVEARRSFAIFGYNNPEVAVLLPRVDNSAYAEVKFDSVALLDRKGRPVEFERQSGGLDQEDMSCELRFEPKAGDDPVDFARATGVARIRYPGKIEVLKLTARTPAAHGVRMRMNGSQVFFQGFECWFGTAPDRFARQQAFDAAGRRLRQLPYADTTTTPDGVWQYTGFWGHPAEVRAIRVVEWVEFDLPYDLAPAKKLPLSKIGQRPSP